MDKTYVYYILNLRNGKRYVGGTTLGWERWRIHRNELDRGEHKNSLLQREWAEYGAGAFKFLPILHCGPGEDLLAWEQYFIDNGAEYNECPTAGNRKGYKLTAGEREVLMKRLNSSEHAEIMRRTHIGKYMSPETRAKIGEAKRQYWIEWRRKNSVR
jgi:group I intron endonuclease